MTGSALGAPDTPAAPLAQVAAGLVAAWEQQCGLVEGAVCYRHDGLVVAIADPGGSSSGAVLVERAPADPARALEVAEGLGAALASPLAVEVAAGADPAWEAALVRAGYRPGLCRSAMVAPLPPAGGARPPLDRAVTPGVRLRPACAADVEALRALEVTCFGLAPASAARTLTAATVADPARSTLVAEGPHGEVRAKAQGHHQGALDVLGIMGVATHPAARRRGLATALVAELLAGAARSGARASWLLADAGANRLYERLGFAHVGDWLTWAHP